MRVLEIFSIWLTVFGAVGLASVVYLDFTLQGCCGVSDGDVDAYLLGVASLVSVFSGLSLLLFSRSLGWRKLDKLAVPDS